MGKNEKEKKKYYLNMEGLLTQLLKIKHYQLFENQIQQNLIGIIRNIKKISTSSFTPDAVVNAITEFTQNTLT